MQQLSQIVAFFAYRKTPIFGRGFLTLSFITFYLYTGFRLTELLNMKTEQVNTKNWYFQGGVKTAAGKERIVPVHDRIKPLVQTLVDRGNK